MPGFDCAAEPVRHGICRAEQSLAADYLPISQMLRVRWKRAQIWLSTAARDAEYRLVGRA